MSSRGAHPILIGVAGGSGSGKTTFVNHLAEKMREQGLRCSSLSQDNYYHDQSHRFDHDGGSVNFDHPEALDFELMAMHLRDLKEGKSIQSPKYCFEKHQRKPQTIEVFSSEIILVDGILIFTSPAVLACLDHKIYMDCQEELRFSRRLARDTTERGRSPEGVQAQFKNQVKPMHDQFVEPCKDLACDIVTPKTFKQKNSTWARKLMEALEQS